LNRAPTPGPARLDVADSPKYGTFPLSPTRLRQGYGGQALPREGEGEFKHVYL
jgi:hypothetical protein